MQMLPTLHRLAHATHDSVGEADIGTPGSCDSKRVSVKTKPSMPTNIVEIVVRNMRLQAARDLESMCQVVSVLCQSHHVPWCADPHSDMWKQLCVRAGIPVHLDLVATVMTKEHISRRLGDCDMVQVPSPAFCGRSFMEIFYHYCRNAAPGDPDSLKRLYRVYIGAAREAMTNLYFRKMHMQPPEVKAVAKSTFHEIHGYVLTTMDLAHEATSDDVATIKQFATEVECILAFDNFNAFAFMIENINRVFQTSSDVPAIIQAVCDHVSAFYHIGAYRAMNCLRRITTDKSSHQHLLHSIRDIHAEQLYKGLMVSIHSRHIPLPYNSFVVLVHHMPNMTDVSFEALRRRVTMTQEDYNAIKKTHDNVVSYMNLKRQLHLAHTTPTDDAVRLRELMENELSKLNEWNGETHVLQRLSFDAPDNSQFSMPSFIEPLD